MPKPSKNVMMEKTQSSHEADSFGRSHHDPNRNARRRLVPDRSGRWFWKLRNYREVSLLLDIYRGLLDEPEAAENLLVEFIAPLAYGTLSIPDVNKRYADSQRKVNKRRIMTRLSVLRESGLPCYKVTLKWTTTPSGKSLIDVMLDMVRHVRSVVDPNTVGSHFRMEISRPREGGRTVHVHGFTLVNAEADVDKLRNAWVELVGGDLSPETRLRTLTHKTLLGNLGAAKLFNGADETVVQAASEFCGYAGKALESDLTHAGQTERGEPETDVDLVSLPSMVRYIKSWQQSSARVITLCDVIVAGNPKILRTLTTGLMHGSSKVPPSCRQAHLSAKLKSKLRKIK